MLGLLEAGARVIRARSTPPAGPGWLEYSERIGWRNRPGTRSYAFAADREFDRDGFFTVDSHAVTREGRRGKRLVLLLGDSRTYGNGVRTEDTYGQVLERRLPGVEVVNRAVPGYSSLQGVIALRADAARLRPDVVVFAFDFNDRRYVLRPADVDGEAHFRRLARLDSWHRLARSLALVDLAVGRGASVERAVDSPLDLGTVRPRVSAGDFRTNLDAAARYSADHGIELVFLLLNDNIVEAHGLEDGADALGAGRPHEAEPALRAAVARSNAFSEAARLQLAMLYERSGRPHEAAAVRVSPRILHSVSGGYPIERGRPYRQIVREVASTRGVRVVDAGSEIDRRPERYFDFCHFDVEGHRVVAELLAGALSTPAAPRAPRQG